MPKVGSLLGGVAVIAVSFLGTLAVLDWFDPARVTNSRRLANASELMSAVERYRKDKSTYPVLTGGPVSQLHAALVDGGYIRDIPAPVDGYQFEYVSDGRKYGFLVL